MLSIRTTQNVGIDFTPASVMHRTIGGVIDALAMTALTVFALLVASEVQILGTAESMVVLALFGCVLLYPVICETLLDGRTLGKMAMKTRVVRLDGRRATLGAFFTRWLIGLFEILMTAGSVGFVMVLVNKNPQRLGDIAAGTSVVVEPKPVTLEDLLLSLGTETVITYPAAQFLTEEEAETIRQVLLASRSGMAFDKVMELLWATSDAFQQRMGEETVSEPWEFLTSVLESYHAANRNTTMKV